MNPRHALPVLALLLAACEPAFDVDVVANAPVDGASVTLRLDGVDLGLRDGGSEARTRSTTGEYRFQRDRTALPADLLSNSDIGGGEYDGVRLRFADDEGSVTRIGVADETIEIGTANEAPVAFVIDEDEDDRVSLVVALDLVLSLRENVDEPGYTLDPLIRAMERNDAASVGGTIAPALLTDPSCALIGARAAVYAFEGADVTPDERDGDASEPLAVSELTDQGAGPASYTLDYLPPGTYTLALTCEAQLENGALPAADDADLDFLASGELTLDPAETGRLDLVP